MVHCFLYYSREITLCFSFDNRKIGPRSKVWCEKEMVDAAAYEFAEVNLMIMMTKNLS